MLDNISDNTGNGTNAATAAITYTLTFSEDMLASSITPDDFTNSAVSSPSLITIGTISKIDTNIFTVLVTPTTPGNLRLTVSSNVTDVAGNPMNGDVDDDDTVLVVANALSLYAAWDLNEGSGTTTTQYQLTGKWNQVINATEPLAAIASTNLSGFANWISASPAPHSKGALSFTGDQTLYQLNTNVDGAGLAGTGAKTFVAWINPTAADGGILSYSPTTGAGSGQDLRLLLDANGYLRGEVSQGWFIYGNESLVGQGWKMVAAIFDGNTSSSKFYIGGVGIVTPTSSGARAIDTSSLSRSIVIGQQETANRPFIGGIDMVAIYLGAANEQHLDAIYANGIASVSNQSGTILILK